MMQRILVIALVSFSFGLFGQTWIPIDNFPNPRHHPIGWGINGKGYVATGTNASDLPTADFHEYDPIADTWTKLTDFPGAARSFAMGVAYQGLGYLGFGATRFNYLNDLWSYDPNTGQWTQLASCPCTGRRHPAMVARGGKIYVGLGDDASGNLRDFWVYDIAINSWSQLPSIPGQGRHHPFQFVSGNQVFAGMGHNGPFIYDDWYKLDTITNDWVIMNDFPGEARVAGTQFDFQGKGYVLSGDGDNHSFMPTGEFWEYDHVTDSWMQLPPHPGVSRWAPGSMVIGNSVYFFGGTNRQSQQNPATAYKYELASSAVDLAEVSDTRFEVYPNPSKGEIRWPDELKLTELQVSDQFGRSIGAYELSGSSHYLSDLTAGIYILQFKTDDGQRLTRRLVLMN